jgi:hypothetical protein
MDILPLFCFALVFTIVCEFCILLVILRENPVKIGLTTIIINILTNPLMNYLLLIHDVPVLILELGVICCEMVMIKYLLRLSWRYALVCSILMNGISWMVGTLIQMVT